MDPNTTVPLNSGGDLPVLGLGTWQLTTDTAGVVEEALGSGYPMIDTSGDYGTQPGIGEGLRRSAVDRDDVFLVSKVEEDDDAYEASARNLEELGVDHVELMLIHRPPPDGVGEELWRGLVRAREEGLARHIGVSNYSIDQLAELADATGEVPAVNQIEWTPFGWSPPMLDYCREHQIVIQAYSPLTRAERLDDERLNRIAAACQRTPAQVVLRWNLQLGTVPLPKANRREHLAENLDVFGFELDEAQMAELGGLNEHWSSLGPSLQYV